MSEPVKVALILAAAIVLSTFVAVYFSSYNSCMRANEGNARDIISRACAGGGF